MQVSLLLLLLLQTYFLYQAFISLRFPSIFFIIVCAKWPKLVLLFGVSQACALAVGIIYLQVTIDPVELWASPESRSRLEKDYFDKSFTPFYRTEQIIIHAEGLEGVR